MSDPVIVKSSFPGRLFGGSLKAAQRFAGSTSIKVQEAVITTSCLLSGAGKASFNGAKYVGSGAAFTARVLFRGTSAVVFLPKTTLEGVVGSAVKEATRSLTEEPHPLLERAYLLLEDLRRQIYAEGPVLTIQETTESLCATLTQSNALRLYVFPKGLRSEDKKALTALGQSLALLIEWDGTSPLADVFNGLEEGFLSLKHHYTPGLLGQIKNSTATILEQATVLPANMARAALGLAPLAPHQEIKSRSPGQGTLSTVAQTAATYTKAGLKKAIDLGVIKDSPLFQNLQARLDGMIQSGNWDEIKTQLHGASSLFQDDGLESFDLQDTEPETLFLPHIRSLGGNSPVPSSSNSSTEELLVSPRTPVESFEMLATREKDLLVDNLTSFLTLSYVSEKVCKLQANHDGYRALLSQHRDSTTKQLLENDLKNAFFLSLKNQSYWVQFKARISYFFLNNIIKYYTKIATTVYFNKILKKIKEGKADHFESLKASLVTNGHEYLAILNGTYNDVRDSKGVSLPLNRLLAEALLVNESKLKSNPKELYKAAFADVLKQTLGKRFGAFVGFFLKRFINPEELVLSLIDSASESIKDKRGYSHSIHKIILEQLDEVWESLRNPNPIKKTIEADPLSRGKKEELSALITELLEVLGKSKFQTKDELSKSSHGVLDTVNHTVDSLAIHNVIESMAVMLSTLTQSILQEDKLQELVYKLMRSTNETFNTQEEISEADKKRVEDAMVLRNKRSLNFIIEGAIREKLANKEDRPGQFIATLRKNSSLFAGEITDLFTLYKKEKSYTLLGKIKKETLFYLGQCETALHEIRKANFSEEEISNVMKYYGHVSKQLAAVTEAIKIENLVAIEEMLPNLCFSPTAMEKAEDFVTQLAYGRAKERIDGLLKLITDPLTLRFGVLHHLLLIPYLGNRR